MVLNSSWCDREEADGEQQIVHRRDDGADGELPFEPEPQIAEHGEDRDDDAERAGLHELAGDGRADDGGLADRWRDHPGKRSP